MLESQIARLQSFKNFFCQDQKINNQNNRWLAQCPSEVPVVMQTKFPTHVVVFGVISLVGDLMPPHIFPQGLRVNSDVYIDVLSTVVLP